MNRKLLLLDIALGIAVIYVGVQFQSHRSAAKARQANMPGPAPKALPVPPVPPLPGQPPVVATGYKDIAMNNLFDASRNPNVPVPEVLPPPPPPPKDPPPLPGFHGMMDLGDGPIALLTDPQKPGYQQVQKGGKIGEFTLVSFDRQEITLDWEGRTIHKRLGEGGNEGGARAKPQPVAGGTEPIPAVGVIPGQAAEIGSAAEQQQQQQRQQLGPGTPLSEGVRACQAGDGSSPGTVADGYVKTVRMTPLGGQCTWRAVGK